MADVDLTANRDGELRATTIAMTILATVFVGLRFVSRQMKGMGIGIDDHIIIVATVFLYLALITTLIGIEYGLGRHMAALSGPDIISYAKSLIAFECLYVTCVCFTKVSLLLMYLRIFPVRNIRIGAYVLGALSIGWCISIIMVSVFQCVPIEKIWDPTLDGFCIDLKKSFVGNAVPNILTDVAILALPMPQVWSLHTSFLQKAQISLIFLLGSFVVFTSIYRFTTLFQFEPSDITATLATAQIWCVVESAAGIISACLPTLGHLVKVVSGKIGLKSGLTWSSQRARTPSAGTQLQTIGGGNASKKGSHLDKTLNSSTGAGSRPFRRISTVSGVSDEQEQWEAKEKVGVRVRAHDLESAESMGTESEEAALRTSNHDVTRPTNRTIMVKTETELAWTDLESDMTQKKHREGDMF